MPDNAATPSATPRTCPRALRHDIAALYAAMDVPKSAQGIRLDASETHFVLVPLLRALHERLKAVEVMVAKYRREGAAHD